MKLTETFVKNYVEKDMDSIFKTLIRAQIGSRLDFQFLLSAGGRTVSYTHLTLPTTPYV